MKNSPTLTKVLYSAGSVLLTIVTIAVTVSFFLAGIKQDIAVMKNTAQHVEENHWSHIQGNLEKQDKWNEKMDDKIEILNENIKSIMFNLDIKE